ncbi:MAG: desulforedoxin [Candidatus Bathyarchaeota archaeon]|nr:desulforedoxin [Candidatus Bathyarchaeota archaeon]
MVKKKGEQYKCEECGLVVLVEDPCGCESCELICCNEPMKLVKTEEKKTPTKT